MALVGASFLNVPRHVAISSLCHKWVTVYVIPNIVYQLVSAMLYLMMALSSVLIKTLETATPSMVPRRV